MSLPSDECPLCELPLDQCVHGNQKAARLDREMRGVRPADCTEGEDGPTIGASMPGTCQTCGGEIEVGEQITHISSGWVHARSKPEQQPNDVSFEGI